MIVFNQTIFNLYEPTLTTTDDGFKNYTKGKCVDVLLPDASRTYLEIIRELTCMLLHHGGAIWLENEADEYTHGFGQIIQMPNEPIGRKIYEDVQGQVVKYLRNVDLNYCFWLLTKSISEDKWLGVIITECNRFKGAHFYEIPSLKDGELPIWFTSKMKHLTTKFDKRLEVSVMLGDEPDIAQHGSLKQFPMCGRPSPKSKPIPIIRPVENHFEPSSSSAKTQNLKGET